LFQLNTFVFYVKDRIGFDRLKEIFKMLFIFVAMMINDDMVEEKTILCQVGSSVALKVLMKNISSEYKIHLLLFKLLISFVPFYN